MPNRTALSVPRTQASYAYPLGVLRNRPYAYFRLNEAAGRDIVNLGSANKGTLANAYSASGVTYGVAGGFASDPSTAVQFDGANGFVTLPMATSQQTNISLECRMLLLSAGAGMAMKVGNRTTGYGMGIGAGTTDSVGTQLVVIFGGAIWVPSGFSMTTLSWHHCVWTFAATNTNTFYVDGVQVAQFSSGAIVLPTSNNFIGNDQNLRYSPLKQTDCAFYNYVLSPAQVAAQALLAQ